MTLNRWLFGSAIFFAAFLLFLVEPMAAKELLPALGGSAAVWITCLVFFQTALLLAYLYAHRLARQPRWQLHLLLMAAALALAVFWAAGNVDLSSGAQHPVTTIFYALGIWIGLPFLALGATSPLLQVWWAQVERTDIPYRLFALSNLGSLLALAAYPTLVEPNFTLRTQRLAWCSGFALFAVLAATLAWRTRAAMARTESISGSGAMRDHPSGAEARVLGAPGGTAEAVPFQSTPEPEGPVDSAGVMQGLKPPPPSAPSVRVSSGTVGAVPFQGTPGPEGQADSAGVMRGLKLPPPSVASCNAEDRAAARSSDSASECESPAPLAHKLLWLLLPMGASMQLSAVTSYITANIAPIPLLWILPLGVYLLSIILAFEFPRLLPRGIIVRLLVVMLGGLAYMLAQVDHSVPISIGIAFFLVELLVAGLFCHVEAYALRPQRGSESTVFYLLFAAGGALGSFSIGIVAPLVFSFNYDVAVTFFITALLALAATWRTGWTQRLLWSAASVMLFVVCIWVHIAYQRGTLVAVRNFYAALRVKQNFGIPGATLRTLTNGTIEHGTQIFGTEAQRKTPTTYYAPDSGVGLALRFCCQGQSGSSSTAGRPRTIGVIGLGAGTIAAYGRAGDRIRFYEINPAVAPIAQNVFTYIRESRAQIEIVPGDARTTLAREAPQQFDVLAVDAFSGDAIPLHLLTAQALALYRRHLAQGGIIAFHISNQHVDLEPAIALLARSAGMRALRFSSLLNEDRNEFDAYWVLLTDNAEFFAQPEVAKAGRAPVLQPGLRLWTDDYSSLLPLLRW